MGIGVPEGREDSSSKHDEGGGHSQKEKRPLSIRERCQKNIQIC